MSEGDTNRLGYLRELAFIAASLVAALLIVRIVFANEVSQGLSANEGLAGFDFVTPGVVSVVVVSIVFYMLRRRGSWASLLPSSEHLLVSCSRHCLQLSFYSPCRSWTS